jgi:hypothetical protein
LTAWINPWETASNLLSSCRFLALAVSLSFWLLPVSAALLRRKFLAPVFHFEAPPLALFLLVKHRVAALVEGFSRFSLRLSSLRVLFRAPSAFCRWLFLSSCLRET